MPLPPPRQANFNLRARIIRWIVLIVVCTIWILMGRTGVREWLKAQEYERDRRETSGVVLSKKLGEIRLVKGAMRTVYIVTFRFVDEADTERTGSARVPLERYNELESGAEIFAIYQAGDIDGLNWIDSDAEHRQSLNKAWQISLLVLAVVLLAGLGIDWYLRLERSLARNGIAVWGTVKSITEHTIKGGRKTWSVAFEFHTEKGDSRNGYSFFGERNRAYVVPVGELMIVLYDPGRTWRHRVVWSFNNVDPKSLLG